MSGRIDDRWLWLSFGIVTIVAVHGIRRAIQGLVAETKLDPYSYEPCEKHTTEHPEDGITIDNLQTLANSPNPNIANSATGLIVSRTLRNPATITSIRQDLRAPDPATRRRATLALDYLRQHSAYDGSLDARPSAAPYNNFGRPQWSAIGTSDGGFTAAEHAVMIDRQRRAANANEPSVAGATRTRLEHRQAMLERAQAEDAEDGFYVPGQTNPWADEGDVVPSIENPVAGWTNVPRARPQRADATEAEVRRQRREAVVVHNGSGELWEEDV